MEDKQILLNNIRVHTTEMGINRITSDVVEFCKNKALDKNCNLYKHGKIGIVKLII